MKTVRIRVFGLEEDPRLTQSLGDGRAYAEFDSFLAVPRTLTVVSGMTFEVSCETPVNTFELGDYDMREFNCRVFATGKGVIVEGQDWDDVRTVLGAYLAAMGDTLLRKTGAQSQVLFEKLLYGSN